MGFGVRQRELPLSHAPAAAGAAALKAATASPHSK
jgi:hypothetical protein